MHSALEYKGNILLKQNKLKQAISAYKQAYTLEKKCISLLGNYSLTLFKLKKFDAALLLVNRGLKLKPNEKKLRLLKKDITAKLIRK